MDALGTLWWLVATVVKVVISLVWFLVSGWVSAIAQIAVIVGVVYGVKYGWRRAPIEIGLALRRVGHFLWSWIRARDRTADGRSEVRDVIREVRVKDWGDVNVSTLMSLAMIIGLVALVART